MSDSESLLIAHGMYHKRGEVIFVLDSLGLQVLQIEATVSERFYGDYLQPSHDGRLLVAY